jgi:cation transport ATPase
VDSCGKNNRTNTLLIGLLISVYVVLYSNINPLTGLGLVGLVTFTFVLFGTYLITEGWNFGEGEFRKAITISVLAVFFATLAFGQQIVIAQDTVVGQVFTNFWAIVSTVVVFYFAARVVDNRTENKTDNGSNSEPLPEQDKPKE